MVGDTWQNNSLVNFGGDLESFKFTKVVIMDLSVAKEGRRTEYADTVINGLRLRVTDKGVKTFCVVRKREGKFIRVTLGKFPDLTIDQARVLMARTLGEVATTGKNPNDERRASEMAVVNLLAALEEYKANRGDRISEKTKSQYDSLLFNFSGDWLGYQVKAESIISASTVQPAGKASRKQREPREPRSPRTRKADAPATPAPVSNDYGQPQADDAPPF